MKEAACEALEKPCRNHELCSVLSLNVSMSSVNHVCAMRVFPGRLSGFAWLQGDLSALDFFWTHVLPPHLPVSCQKCQKRFLHFLRHLVNHLSPAAWWKKTSVVWMTKYRAATLISMNLLLWGKTEISKAWNIVAEENHNLMKHRIKLQQCTVCWLWAVSWLW